MSERRHDIWRAIRNRRPQQGWFVSCGVYCERPKVIRWGWIGHQRARLDLLRSRGAACPAYRAAVLGEGNE